MTQLNVDNFTAETGKRFRVNNFQKARIEITKLDDAQRTELESIVNNRDQGGVFPHDIATFFGLSEMARWINNVADVINNWSEEMPLTREGAFQEFMDAKGLDRLQNQKPDVPEKVFLDEGLTLDNFEDKVFEAIGVKRRFRVSRDQHARIDNGDLTREEAFLETVAQVRAKQQTEVS